MSLPSRDVIDAGVYDALKSEVRVVRDDFKIVLQGLSEPAEAAEVPWLSALTWLSLSRSAASLIANLAPSAAIPVWIFDQAAIAVDSAYAGGLEGRDTDRRSLAAAVKDKLADAINDSERDIWTSRPVQAALARLRSHMGSPQARVTYDGATRSQDREFVEVTCRRIIKGSGILISRNEDIRRVMSSTFMRMFSKVYEIYSASPLRKGFDLGPIVHSQAVIRRDRISKELGEMEAFSSLSQMREVCFRYKQGWLGTPSCVDSMRVGRLEGQDAFLYVLSHAGAFEVRLHEEMVMLPNSSGRPLPYAFKIVELIPRFPSLTPVGFLADAQIPEMLRAIDRAFWAEVNGR